MNRPVVAMGAVFGVLTLLFFSSCDQGLAGQKKEGVADEAVAETIIGEGEITDTRSVSLVDGFGTPDRFFVQFHMLRCIQSEDYGEDEPHVTITADSQLSSLSNMGRSYLALTPYWDFSLMTPMEYVNEARFNLTDLDLGYWPDEDDDLGTLILNRNSKPGWQEFTFDRYGAEYTLSYTVTVERGIRFVSKQKITSLNSGKALTVRSASMAPGANVFQYAYSAGNNQNDEWCFVHVGNNVFKIIALHSKLYLECRADSLSSWNVVQNTRHNGSSQLWKLSRSGDCYKMQNLWSGKYLAVDSYSLADEVNVVCADEVENAANQSWKVTMLY